MNGELVQIPDLPAVLGQDYDVTTEEGFVAAGVALVELGRACLLALGQLLLWKLHVERAHDEGARTAILDRYARAWGVSRTSLVKALVSVERFPAVARPQDAPTTVVYEVLSGAADEADAEAGFDAVAANGWSVHQVREAKYLRAVVPCQAERKPWAIPFLYHDEGAIWARDDKGRSVRVATLERADDPLVQAGLHLLRYRGRF